MKWNEPALLTLISDQIEEADQLEYKGARSLKKADRERDEIGKDVSSFANAGGGTIIYGINEFDDTPRRHLPEKLDPIDREESSREWLEQVINRIEPRIPNLKIIPVPLSSSKRHVAYVVEIPKGETAHQAPSGRYYRRYNFEAQWMKDHEIRDVMSRKKFPEVATEIKMWINSGKGNAGLFWRLTNTGNTIARHVMSSIQCPMQVKGYFLAEPDGETYNSECDDDAFVYWKLVGSNKLGLPLFPGAELSRVFKFNLSGNVRWDGEVKQLKTIRFRTFADEMPFITGEVDPNETAEVVSRF